MKTSKLSYAEITAKYGISRNKIQSLMLNHFKLPEAATLAIDTYMILSYSGSSVSGQIYDGTLYLHGIEYAVVYKDCKPAQVKNASRVSVSYRSAHEELNLQPIAIIKIEVM